MKIFLFGNVGSGKSTIAHEIVAQHPEIEYLAIDEYRKRFSDGSMEAEKATQQRFVGDVTLDAKIQLIECSGLGDVGLGLQDKFEKYEEPVLVVVLMLTADECIQRIANRVWDTPFPKDHDHILDWIERVDLFFGMGDLCMRWSNYGKTSILQTPNRTESDKYFILKTVDSFLETRVSA